LAKAAAFGSRVIILDEPTAALGVRESNRVLEQITDLRNRRLALILVSHNMPRVFEVSDRIMPVPADRPRLSQAAPLS
jgi:fructose transport system ATP-binding protein